MGRFPVNLGVLLAATALFAQGPEPSGVTIRTTTTLVQVGVVVRDAKGKAVTGLKKEDFEILDNGKPQPIAVFYGLEIGSEAAAPIASAAAAPVPAAPSAPAASPGTFTNQLAEKPSARGGYSIILLDWSNTGPRNSMRAREQARQAVERLDPAEKIGLYSLDHGEIKVVNEVGSSKAAVLKSLKTMVGLPSPCYQDQMDGLDNAKAEDSISACAGPPNPRELVVSYVKQRSQATVGIFEGIAAHLSGLPGRKSLIWISAGFPRYVEVGARRSDILGDEAIDRTVRKLNNADVALYPVDARGVTVESTYNNPNNFTWSAMDEFAKRTGGKVFSSDNGLDVGIQAAVEDGQANYMLAYYAPQDDSQAGFHKLTVRALRPGVNLRYKEGYFVDAPGKTGEKDRKDAVAEALTALVDATSIPLEIKATRQNNSVKLRVSLQPDTLALKQKGDRWQGTVEFVTRFAKEDGSESAPPVSRRIELNLTRKTYETAERSGLVLLRTLELPAGAVKLRVLVWTDPSGEIGTLTIRVADVAAN
jgi:VWFA-related protein